MKSKWNFTRIGEGSRGMSATFVLNGVRASLAKCVLAALLLTLGSILPASASETAAAGKNAGEGKSGTTNNASAKTIAGERFSVRQVVDRQQGGLIACAFSVPEKWQDQSQVIWNYAYISAPVQVLAKATNATTEESFFLFPAAQFFSVRPDGNFFRPGQNYGGLIFVHQPLAPAQMLGKFVQQTRSSYAKFKIVGGKDLPGLAKALNYPMWGNDHGVALKATYELNGKPFEEEFYAVAYSVDIPYDGPQGRTWQINWGLRFLHSFRAPAGTLDKRREAFAAIAKSFKINPAWQQRVTAINAYLTEQFNRQLQAGYDSIAAAGRLSQQISANNDAMIANIDRQLSASRTATSSATPGSSRSATDNFDDYIRGVDTVNDPYSGTSQHSSLEQYHWTDGYGSYRNSNDSNYNPNHQENGDWQLMTPAQ